MSKDKIILAGSRVGKTIPNPHQPIEISKTDIAFVVVAELDSVFNEIKDDLQENELKGNEAARFILDEVAEHFYRRIEGQWDRNGS